MYLDKWQLGIFSEKGTTALTKIDGNATFSVVLKASFGKNGGWTAVFVLSKKHSVPPNSKNIRCSTLSSVRSGYISFLFYNLI